MTVHFSCLTDLIRSFSNRSLMSELNLKKVFKCVIFEWLPWLWTVSVTGEWKYTDRQLEIKLSAWRVFQAKKNISLLWSVLSGRNKRCGMTHKKVIKDLFTFERVWIFWDFCVQNCSSDHYLCSLINHNFCYESETRCPPFVFCLFA